MVSTVQRTIFIGKGRQRRLRLEELERVVRALRRAVEDLNRDLKIVKSEPVELVDFVDGSAGLVFEERRLGRSGARWRASSPAG